MKYSRCYRDLHQEYGGCVGPKDWAKNQKRIFVCQVYKQLEDCYYNLTLYTCGNNAAENMKQFVEWVTNSVITVDCGLEQNSSERRSTGQNGDISSMDIPAEKSSSANPHLPLYISIGIILLIVIITIIFYVKKWYANRAKSNRAEEEALLRNNS
ncbi:hypothetical protein ANN_01270 [Periplaneta americana]|uniref:Uncharacterized protein n=1 Tax=Periplaneta americana TaxID=6978 RepID=A0ABQ8TT73_PERAM|nr:hypothetical protein ANN_01270 [Periplaneta americana]